MESSSPLHSVPPRKALRDGQRRVVEAALRLAAGTLPVQLPTGYGKTLAAAATFVAMRERGDVTRLLYLVPTTAQLRQFCSDGRDEFRDAGLDGVAPFDIGYSPTQALARHRRNQTVVFAATIQAVVSGSVGMAVKEMLQTGQWMIVVDEYHHYGVDNVWGRAVLDMGARFLLAMSATPERKNQDSAFGAPAVRIRYREAEEADAAKTLRLHAYEYRVDAITVNGEPVSFTTSEVVEAVGSDDPHAIDKYIVDRKLRWSPKYISPLVSIPIERLLSRRRGLPLQMIVGAMGCLHARMVCEQIKTMFGDLLRIDWVGTGPNGRTDAENEAIIAKFCPPKENGVRRPENIKLDVLVHVGMAGEGLDSVFVTEVVHLNKATISNQNDQENGRASRRIPGAPEELQTAFINVDSSSPYAEWTGSKVMDVFDRENGEVPPEREDETPEPRELSELPDEPTVMIADCELERIEKGDPEVKGCAVKFAEAGGIDVSVLNDPNHWVWDAAIQLRRKELIERAKGQDGMSVLYQLKDSVRSAVGKIASLSARQGSSMRFERSLIGDLMKRIYTEMRKRFGAGVDNADEAGLRARYAWLKTLEVTVRKEGVPTWLK